MKSLNGLHPTLMRPRVEAVLADPDAKMLGLYTVSAFRSVERQRELFAAAVKKYGSEAKARKWVAPPGKSNHGPKVEGFGTAVDFGVPGHKPVSGRWPDAIRAAVDKVCARHGLQSPMAWEDWHYEPDPKWKPGTTPTTPVLSHNERPRPVVHLYVDSLVAPNGGTWHLQADGGIITDTDGVDGPKAPYYGSVPGSGGLGAAKAKKLLPHGQGYKVVVSHQDESISYFHFPAT